MKLSQFIKSSMIFQYTALLLVLLIIPVAVFSYISQRTISDMENHSANQYLSSNLQVVSTTIDGVLTNLEHSHTSLILNTEFTHTLRKLSKYGERDLYTDYLQTNTIKNQIVSTAITSNYIYSIYAYSYPANRIFSSKINWNSSFNDYDYPNSEWLNSYNNSRQNTDAPWIITSAIEDGRSIIASYRSVKEYGMDDYGLVSINVDISMISDMLNNLALNEDTLCFMMDGNGTFIDTEQALSTDLYNAIISGLPAGQSNGLYSIKLDGRKYFIFFMLSDYSKFTYIIATPASAIETVTPIVHRITTTIIISLIVLLLLFLILSYFYFYRPIRALSYHMHEVEKGNFDTRLPESSVAEIGYINTSFNQMASNIEKLINENYITQLVSKEAELKALRSQINEHFLYNTLDTIHWKSRMENAPDTGHMIFLLAEFYRLSLSSGQEYISVGEVILQISRYLEIQKIRMGEMLEYQISCDDSLQNIPVLKYLFQPIIENAVLHGGKNLERPEHLSILFEDHETYLHFQVHDDGSGIKKESLDKLLESIQKSQTATGEYFALKLIHKQLKLSYGEFAVLHIESSFQKGCTVWFDLPISDRRSAINAENDYH